MNWLGSCKHIERVLQSVQHRKKRAFARAAEAGSPVYEIFMDVREPERREVPAVERRPKRLKEELTARHADIILGIEQNVKTGGTVVVSRPGTDTESLRRTAKAAGASAEVITPEIHALLLRLQKMGVLTLSSELDTLHATAGYTPLLSESPSPPKLHRAAARSVWTSVAAERRAVEALTGVGLLEQALPHLKAVLAAGRKAIAVLHRGPDADEDAGATELPTEARALSSVLAAFDGREDGDAVQEGLDLVAQVDAELAD